METQELPKQTAPKGNGLFLPYVGFFRRYVITIRDSQVFSPGSQ
jgi:hypothetical protein